MRKLLPVLTLIAALLVVSAPTNQNTVIAQGAKKDKDVKTAPKGAAGVIEIAKGKDDKFRFFVRDGDGKLLAMSSPTGFATEKDAKDAVESLKKIVATAKVIDKKVVKDKEK